MASKTVLPYKDSEESKKEQVASMFDKISSKYDLLNHVLSMGIDILWRKKAVKLLKKHSPKQILDVATGTGDFAIEAMSLNPDHIEGIDISKGMLEVGKKKVLKLGLQDKINLQYGDSEDMPYENESFDAIIVGFGVRNFAHLEKGLQEFYRVLKKDGVVVVLEFSKPTIFPFKQLYTFYFKYILPKVGKLISKDNSAYTYLPESVNAFPNGDAFLEILQKLKFKNTKCKQLTLGISSIYIGEK